MSAPLDRIDRLFAYAARSIPQNVQLVLLDGTLITYAETFARAQRIAGAMVNAGLERGDRVLLFMGNSRELVELYIACSLAGVICVPVNTLTTARELVNTAADCTPSAAFFQAPFRDRIQSAFLVYPQKLKVSTQGEIPGWQRYDALLEQSAPLEQPVSGNADDPCVMIYSSGTTGTPKGILLRERAVIENAHLTNLHMRYQMRERVLTMLPLFSSFGYCWDFLMTAQVGASTVLLPKFDPAEAVSAIERLKVSAMCGVPTMYARLFEASNIAGRDLSSLRLIDVGGGPVSDRLKHDLKHVHGIEVVESYGLTEISPVASVQIPFTEHRIGSCGPALPGIEVKVLDENDREVPVGTPGELCFRCTTFMVGYWHKPDETARVLRDGWLHSGDIGVLDADGHIYYRDRLKDMIVTNGNNVYPKEVENALCEHAAVQSAAVVGIPDEIRGEIVHAFVVCKPGRSIAADALIEHCARLIGRHKLPKGVTFVAELPLTASGKIQRYQLRALLQGGS